MCAQVVKDIEKTFTINISCDNRIPFPVKMVICMAQQLFVNLIRSKLNKQITQPQKDTNGQACSSPQGDLLAAHPLVYLICSIRHGRYQCQVGNSYTQSQP